MILSASFRLHVQVLLTFLQIAPNRTSPARKAVCESGRRRCTPASTASSKCSHMLNLCMVCWQLFNADKHWLTDFLAISAKDAIGCLSLALNGAASSLQRRRLSGWLPKADGGHHSHLRNIRGGICTFVPFWRLPKHAAKEK